MSSASCTESFGHKKSELNVSLSTPLTLEELDETYTMKTRQMRESLVLCAVIWTSIVINDTSAFSLQMSATKTAVIAGATGYIGKSVVRESVRQGYRTIALVRDKSKVTSKEGEALYGQFLEGADVVECDVCDPVQLTKVGMDY